MTVSRTRPPLGDPRAAFQLASAFLTSLAAGARKAAGRLERGRRAVIIGVWAVWSIVILVLALSVRSLPVATRSGWDPELLSAAPPLARWDSGWYYDVAKNGFRYDPAVSQNNVAFYPLYPLLMRWLNRLSGLPLLWAGMLISLASLLAALLLMGDLASEFLGAEGAVPAVCALLFYPTAFFLVSVYSESLFLLTTTLAFWAARRSRWLLAGVAGALAGMTRFNGFLIALPLAWFAWEDAGRRLARLRIRPASSVLLAIGGAATFPLFLWHRFGDPLLYLHSTTQGWPQKPAPFWGLISSAADATPAHLRTLFSGTHWGFWLELASAALFTILTVGLFRSSLIPEALYCAATLLLLFDTGTLYGWQRYVLVLFPCFFILARLRYVKIAAFAYAFAGSCTGIVLMTRFIHWLFVD